MSAFDQPDSWINRQLAAGEKIEEVSAGNGPNFAGGGDYYYPALQQETIPQGRRVVYQNGIPVYRNRTLDVGHNTYNIPGSYEADIRYGLPPVITQSEPYARIAYQVGPNGVMPMVGYPSVYPHVLDATRVHYGDARNAYIQGLLGASDFSFTDMMNRAERMMQLAMRARAAGGSGGGTSQKKTDTTNQTAQADDVVALPPEGAMRIAVPQTELPKPVAQEQGERWLDARRSAALKNESLTPYIRFGEDNTFLLNDEMDYRPPVERRGRSLSMTPERAAETLNDAMTPASRNGVYVTPPRFSVETPQERMRRRIQRQQELASKAPMPALPTVPPLQEPLVAMPPAVPQRSALPPSILVFPEVK